MGLRFSPRSGCLSYSEMDIDNPESARREQGARRARAIIVIMMAVFIAAPFIIWLITGRGAPHGP